MYENDDMQDYICAGPLTLCRLEKQANTVMGTELSLEEKTFDALEKLVSQEGEALTLKQLVADIWDGDADAAWPELSYLTEQVNIAGQGFMLIEYKENTGYVFRTRWAKRLPSKYDTRTTGSSNKD